MAVYEGSSENTFKESLHVSDDQELAKEGEMESTELEQTEPNCQVASITFENSPRSANSEASSSEIFTPTPRQKTQRPRPKSVRNIPGKPTSPKQPQGSSSIPLPVKSPAPKVPPLLKNARSSSRTSSIIPRASPPVASKRTLEVQFMNKNKRYLQMKQELVQKQRPVIDLYQNLLTIKKKLEELGKTVKLEDIKLVPIMEYDKKPEENAELAAGDEHTVEVIHNMKCSIEEIPKTLMDICKNLLSRRALIVELLESVTKSEVDVNQVSNKIESLKSEGYQLQQSLDAVIDEHESKISDLVNNWQKLLNEKQMSNTDTRVEELEASLKEEERLREESLATIEELRKTLDQKSKMHEKSMNELNAVLHSLREQIRKLEQDLDNERKITIDFKSRNTTTVQTMRTMRTRISELENEKKEVENSNAELQRKFKFFQDQQKHKEAQYEKEKDDMAKRLKHQENLLQKLTAERNQFETRKQQLRNDNKIKEDVLQNEISTLKRELEQTQNQLVMVTTMKDQAVEKCCGFEQYISRMGIECKETMNRVSYSIEWGKAQGEIKMPEAENYMNDVAKDLLIRELQDKIHDLEREKKSYTEALETSKVNQGDNIPSMAEIQLNVQKDQLHTYEVLLAASQQQLKDKSLEIDNLRAEIRQLKVRQESIEEHNDRYSVEEMQRQLNEGRQKLKELMDKTMESDSKLEEYRTTVEKQNMQLNEMDNLLRYRENMTNVLKSSRNELLAEKDSLARYSTEVRAALAEVTNEIGLKDSHVKALQEKVLLQQSQIRCLELEVHELEEKLRMANEKRYKLQETVGSLEKDLQRARSAIGLAGTRKKSVVPWGFLDSVCEVVEDKPSINKISHYSNSLMDSYDDNNLGLEMQHRHIGETPPSLEIASPLRKKLYDSRNILNRIRRDFDQTSSSYNSSDYASAKPSFPNVSSRDESSSLHTHCHHKANSRSLISLSLHTVDLIKTKLNYLNSVSPAIPEKDTAYDEGHDSQTQTPQLQLQSQQTDDEDENFDVNKTLDRIMHLTARRYEYLHNQAQESYDELADLVKLAVAQQGANKK